MAGGSGPADARRDRDGLRLSFRRSVSAPGGVPALPPSARSATDGGCTAVTSAATTAASAAAAEAADVAAAPASSSLPTSPSSEAAQLRCATLLSRVHVCTGAQLAQRLQQLQTRAAVQPQLDGLVVLDVRPFTAFNKCHVRGAVNVSCLDRINRRRLQTGRASLSQLASSREARELLRRRAPRDVVVCDEGTGALQQLPGGHPLLSVMAALLEDGRQPALLAGGMSEFGQRFADLCTSELLPPAGSASPAAPASPAAAAAAAPAGGGGAERPEPRTAGSVEGAPITQVLPYLYVGNQRDAADAQLLTVRGITRVLNVTVPARATCYRRLPAVRYKTLPAADTPQQNISQYFDEAIEFIDEARRSEARVLVHCVAGVSRSPTIAIAYLMKRGPMSLREAYRLVKARRPIISPNLNFMGQLVEWERRSEGSSSSGAVAAASSGAASTAAAEAAAILTAPPAQQPTPRPGPALETCSS